MRTLIKLFFRSSIPDKPKTQQQQKTMKTRLTFLLLIAGGGLHAAEPATLYHPDADRIVDRSTPTLEKTQSNESKTLTEIISQLQVALLEQTSKAKTILALGTDVRGDKAQKALQLVKEQCDRTTTRAQSLADMLAAKAEAIKTEQIVEADQQALQEALKSLEEKCKTVIESGTKKAQALTEILGALPAWRRTYTLTKEIKGSVAAEAILKEKCIAASQTL
ncbi:MAG: hypothetical protein ABIP97_10770 [Chthoniobacterales bacterium]